MSYAKMMNRPRGAVIRAYRASGRMFGQTFNAGRLHNETKAGRALTCARLQVSRWFATRNDEPTADRRRHARECVREAIEDLRALQLNFEAAKSAQQA